MLKINVRDMRASIGKLGELVDRAGELIVTRHGKEIARILPVRRQRQRPSHADLRNRTGCLGTGSESLIRGERDER
jgi:prevent-host-death family protein